MTLSEIFIAIFGFFAKSEPKPEAASPAAKPSLIPDIPNGSISPAPTALNQPSADKLATLVAIDWLSLCLPVTKHYETCILHAYPDPASPLAKAMQAAGIWYNFLAGKVAIPSSMQQDGSPWTIGWGTTGSGIQNGVVWTQSRADSSLIDRLNSAASAVDRLVKVALTAAQKAALTDLVYNIGEGNFASSTLLRLLNQNSMDAAEQILVWDKAGGEVSNGLVARRKTDYDLFTTGSYQL